MSIFSRTLVPGALLLVLGLAVPTTATAAEPQDRQGWFDRQLTHFKAYPHLDMAYRRLRQNEPAEAATEFERYLRLKPDDTKARADYMNVLLRLHRHPEAQAEARRILATAPDDTAALLALGQSLVVAGDNEAAVGPLRKAVEASRNDPARHREAVLTAVDALARLGHNKDALALLDSLPSTPPTFDTAQIRGTLLTRLNDNTRAREAFATALGLAQNDRQKLDALRSLGVAATSLGQDAQARDALTKARELAPGDTDILRQLAMLAAKGGNSQEAARLGRQLAEKAPTLENREFLATVLGTLGNTQEAIDVLWPLRREKLPPTQAAGLDMRLGLLLMKAGKPDQAVTVLRDAVARQRSALGLVRLSRALQQAGQAQEAAKALEEAVALGAKADTLLELATLQQQLDANAAALQSLDKALGQPLQPEERLRSLSMKAQLLGEANHDAEARATLQEALKAPGKDKPRLLLALGETCLRLADYPAAVAAFTQADEAGAAGAKPALAQALIKNNQPDKALSIYAALAGETDDAAQKAAFRLNQANLLAGLGHHDQAAALYKELADAGQPQLLLQAGQSYAAARAYGAAAQSFNAYADKAGDPVTRAEVLLALGNVYAAERQPAKAYEAFSRAAALAAALPRDKQAAIALGRGNAAMLAGKPALAIEPLQQAASLLAGGADKAKAWLTLAQVYTARGESQNAAAALRQAAAIPGLPRGDLATAQADLGNVLAKTGDLAGAAAAFQAALAIKGNDWRTLASLGQVAYGLGRYQEAADVLARSLALHADATTRIALGRCYEKLGKPGLALVAFGQAAPDVSGLPPREQRQFQLDTGFLYAAEYRYDAAVTAFKTALAISYDAANAVRLGRLERLAGQPDAAQKTLEAVDQAALPRDLAVLRLSELADLAEAARDYDTAKTHLEAALALAPDADTAFRLGNVLRDSGHPEAAVDAYRRAVTMDDANRYMTALGYALSTTRHYPEAAKVFETVLSRDQDYLPLWEDLGYAYMHGCDNAKAVDRFKRAIDNAPLRPVDSQADREKLAKDVHRLRQEVTKLETHFTTTAYMSYIAGEAGRAPAVSGNSPDTIRSGAGAEFAWIPPKIGFRDDRILQLIARFSANFNKDSLDVDDTSWQGAVGLRYKPLQSQNLNVGVERLFKIGKAAEENWLARAMYSWTDGYDVKPGEARWNYTFFYGEYDYYMEKDPRSMFYAEGRQGITFNLGDRFLVTPHVVADVRWWTPDLNLSSLVEGGGGISLKYLFNRADYEVERSSLEFLLQYKYGKFFNKIDVRNREDIVNALFLTTVLKF